MAGAAFAGQIWTVLDTMFEELNAAGQKLLREFSPSAVEADILADVDSRASSYLAIDLLVRNTTGPPPVPRTEMPRGRYIGFGVPKLACAARRALAFALGADAGIPAGLPLCAALAATVPLLR
jgi:hypothetical protein